MIEVIQPVLETLSSIEPVRAVETVTQVLGSLVIVGRGLEGVAKITPTKKDDKVVSKLNSGINKASNFLLQLGTLRAALSAKSNTK